MILLVKMNTSHVYYLFGMLFFSSNMDRQIRTCNLSKFQSGKEYKSNISFDFFGYTYENNHRVSLKNKSRI